jgi:hypothetical protein
MKLVACAITKTLHGIGFWQNAIKIGSLGRNSTEDS